MGVAKSNAGIRSKSSSACSASCHRHHSLFFFSRRVKQGKSRRREEGGGQISRVPVKLHHHVYTPTAQTSDQKVENLQQEEDAGATDSSPERACALRSTGIRLRASQVHPVPMHGLPNKSHTSIHTYTYMWFFFFSLPVFGRISRVFSALLLDCCRACCQVTRLSITRASSLFLFSRPLLIRSKE